MTRQTQQLHTDGHLECCICAEIAPASNILKLACGCLWCRTCLNHHVRLSLNGQDHFPPRCCDNPQGGTSIDLVHAQTCLDDSVATRLAERWDELHATDPTYCASPRCSAFIPDDDPSRLDEANVLPKGLVFCRVCKKYWTCRRCKQKLEDHLWYDFGEYFAIACATEGIVDDATLELMRQNNWRMCPQPWCRKVIERTEGCDLMMCKCGYLFC